MVYFYLSPMLLLIYHLKVMRLRDPRRRYFHVLLFQLWGRESEGGTIAMMLVLVSVYGCVGEWWSLV